MKIGVFSLNDTERKNPPESFLGLGWFVVWNTELFKSELCFWEGGGPQLCVYPSFLVRNLPWAQERAGSRRLLQSIPQRGRRCREPGSYHTVNLYVVLPYKNKPQSVSRPREKDRSEPGLRLCQQGRLASLRKVMIPTRSFAVADDGGGGKEKVLQGKLNLPSERNENQAWL